MISIILRFNKDGSKKSLNLRLGLNDIDFCQMYKHGGIIRCKRIHLINISLVDSFLGE